MSTYYSKYSNSILFIAYSYIYSNSVVLFIAHEGSVRGVGVMLQYIITGGADGMIKVINY